LKKYDKKIIDHWYKELSYYKQGITGPGINAGAFFIIRRYKKSKRKELVVVKHVTLRMGVTAS